MKIDRSILRCRVVESTPAERLWLDSFLVFDGPARQGQDGERIRLLDLRTSTFPSGLLPLVRRGAASENVQVHVRDLRKKPPGIDPAVDLGWLEHRRLKDGSAYQIDAIRSMMRATVGVLKAAVASGKAECAIGLAKSVPVQWLFLVHRQHLRADVTERWDKRGDGTPTWDLVERMDLAPRLTTCTFQTLHRALDRPEVRRLLDRVVGVIIDECHTVGATTYLEVAEALPNAYYRFGLSGTPLDRTDKRSILALATLGPIVHRVSSRALIDAGFAAEPIIRMVEHRGLSASSPGEGWHDCYRRLVVESPGRNELLVEIAKTARKPAILFVKAIEHGKALTKQIERAGINATFAWGSWGLKKRRAVCEQLARGEIEVLVANAIFEEGLDVPALRAVINGAGGASTISTIQRAGRGMRIEFGPDGRVLEDSRTFELWDVADRGHAWIQRHAMARERDYRREEWAVEVISPGAPKK